MKIDKTTGQYRIQCFTCQQIIMSYNYPRNAKRAFMSHSGKGKKHDLHDLKLIDMQSGEVMRALCKFNG